MSCSSAETSRTSAAANDGAWHGCSASRRVDARTRHGEVGLHTWLVIVRSDVLLHFQLHPVAAWGEVWWTEGALQTKRSPRQVRRPVAVNVHVASEQRSMVAANRDHEDRLRQIFERAPRHLHGERLAAVTVRRRVAAAIQHIDSV